MAENIKKRSGWVTFAGVMAVVAGGYNALSGTRWQTTTHSPPQASDVLYGIDLTAWGWFWLDRRGGPGNHRSAHFGRNVWGLWLGVGIACASALMTVFVMFVFPLWAIAVLTIDFLVLFGLLTESDEFLA